MLAQEEGHPSTCEDELYEDESELAPPDEIPVGSGEGACGGRNEDEAYIEALEPLKFDTAELVVRIQRF